MAATELQLIKFVGGQKTNFQRMITALLAGLKVQSTELSALQETFTSLDTDKDGFLSASELRENLYGVFSSRFEQNM